MKTAPGSMPWEQAARATLENVPFFVRKKVKARIEATALAEGISCVSLKDVPLARKAFMEGQETMVTGLRWKTVLPQAAAPTGFWKRMPWSGGWNSAFHPRIFSLF